MLLKKPTHPITVRNVLTHTSGLPFSSPIEKPTLDLLPLDRACGSYAMRRSNSIRTASTSTPTPASTRRGASSRSSAACPTRSSWTSASSSPLGMKDTTFWPNEEQLQRLAKSYKPNKDKTDLEETPIGQLKYPLNDRTRQPMPAGGLFSTATDLAKFCQMILNSGELEGKRYLSEAAVKQMTSRQTGDASSQATASAGPSAAAPSATAAPMPPT